MIVEGTSTIKKKQSALGQFNNVMKPANYVGQKGTILKDYSKVSVDDFTNILVGKFTVYLVKETRVECNPKKT